MRTAWFALIIICVAGSGRAQSDRVILSAEADRVVCELQVPGPGFHKIHMIHQGRLPRESVIFRAETPACWPDAVWLGDIVLPPLTKAQSTHGYGIMISYVPPCDALPGYLGYMNFYAPSAVPPCCWYPITPHQHSPEPKVYVTDCDYVAHEAGTGSLLVNPDVVCSCEGPIATENTTWGRMKALYR